MVRVLSWYLDQTVHFVEEVNECAVLKKINERSSTYLNNQVSGDCFIVNWVLVVMHNKEEA